MRENQAEYVVTYHGRLVAVLLPVAEAWLAAEAKRAAEAVAAGEVTWANGLLSHCLTVSVTVGHVPYMHPGNNHRYRKRARVPAHVVARSPAEELARLQRS